MVWKKVGGIQGHVTGSHDRINGTDTDTIINLESGGQASIDANYELHVDTDWDVYVKLCADGNDLASLEANNGGTDTTTGSVSAVGSHIYIEVYHSGDTSHYTEYDVDFELTSP